MPCGWGHRGVHEPEPPAVPAGGSQTLPSEDQLCSPQGPSKMGITHILLMRKLKLSEATTTPHHQKNEFQKGRLFPIPDKMKPN